MTYHHIDIIKSRRRSLLHEIGIQVCGVSVECANPVFNPVFGSARSLNRTLHTQAKNTRVCAGDDLRGTISGEK